MLHKKNKCEVVTLVFLRAQTGDKPGFSLYNCRHQDIIVSREFSMVHGSDRFCDFMEEEIKNGKRLRSCIQTNC